MLLSVIAEYQNSPIVKMLEVDERTGDLKIFLVDSSDTDSLQELQMKLESGLDFADFQIIKSKVDDNMDADELRHFCSNVAPGEPDLSIDGLTVKDSPSFLGFIRKLIRDGGSIVLPLNNVPEKDIPHWMVTSASSIQLTEDMGIKVSHLIPGKEEDHWRWSSSVILQADNNDKFGDVTGHLFLTLTDFDPEEYAPYLVEHAQRNVIQENGVDITYRVFSVTEDLPIYTTKSNIVVTPAIISRLKYVADSYKLALYSLTENLFEEKKMEYYSGERNAPVATGRFMKLKNTTPVSKKTASAMLDYMLDSLRGNSEKESEAEFLKKYPHYQVFTSIIKNQIHIFFGPDTSKHQKLKAYRALKNVETLFNILLQECRYHVMFDNDAYLFNLWTSTMSFNSDIPNYKITISGGGGTWRPNDLLF